MYGTNPAYLRSVGYQGFAHTTANNKGGFMMFSGSIGSGASGGNRITASEAYDGVGLEIVDAHDSDNHRFLKFRTNPSEFTVQTDQFFFGKDGQFISGSNGNIVISSSNFFLGGENTFVSGANDKLEISSSNFHLDNDGSVIMQGTITAEAGGKIGGFTIGSASMFSGADEVNTTFFLSGSGHSGTNFVKSNLVISSSGFQVNSTGEISSSAGNISGFTITGGSGATGAADAIHSADKSLILSGSGQITGSNVLFTGGKIGSFNIGKTTNATPLGVLFSDSNELVITGSTGQITGSQVLFTGGKIGGFTIDADEIKSTNLLLDSNNEKITVGSANAVTIQGGSEDNFITMGKTTFGESSTVGAILGMDDDKPTLELFKDANNQFIFNNSGIDIKSTTFDLNAGSGKLIIDSSTPSISLTDATAKLIVGNLDSVTDTSDGDKGIYAQGDGKLLIKEDASNYIQFNGGLDIKTETFKLDTDRLDIDSSTSRISVFDDAGSPKEVVRIGEVDGATNYGMKIFDGTGTADSDILVEFSETENTIAGWDISTSTISKNNIVIDSSGFISSQGYASNVQGFFLGARALSDGSVGSFLEVDEANIRGTLKTTVFEKESVNAVGGQLMIANSTTITGSVSMSATATTMSVANSSGFAAGEIILAKKFNATGFSTEYMRVNSASREDNTSDVNFSGSLMVTRALGRAAPQGTVSSSIGFSGSVGQEYTPGQVIVSTGKIGTGYIRLNANPNDQTTPYMDIVERTGSGVYDINLKARLGDLSGVVDTINGQSVSGFGLYTDNAFLKGGIVASYGSIGGFNMSSTDLWAGNATLGNAGTVMVLGDTNTSTPKIALGGQANNITATSGTGIYMDGSSNAKFRVGNPSGQNIYWNGSTLSVAGSITISNPGDIDISDLNNDSGFTDDSTANAATGSAATAQSTANAATGSAAAAQATANAATGSAATAQAAIDLMETRVVIDNTGMALKAKSDAGSGTLNGQTIAEYGTTTTFFDGVASADANKKLELNASGITLFGSQAGNDYLFLEAGGIEMRSNNVRTLHITDHGINIGPSATGPGSANTPSAVAGNISLHGQGARIYGEATNDYVDVKANGVDVVTAGATVAEFAADTTITGGTITLQGTAGSTGDEKLVIANNSITIDSAGNEVFNVTGGTITLKTGTSSHEKVVMSNASIAMFSANSKLVDITDGKINIGPAAVAGTAVTGNVRVEAGNVYLYGDNTNTFAQMSSAGLELTDDGTKRAVFAATTTIGDTATEHISISSTELKIKDGNGSGTDIDYVTINSSGMNIGNNISLGTNGNATFSGNVQIGSGESVFKADSNGIYLGNETFGSAEFRVTPAGAVTATNATLTGAVTATSGDIAGWTISGNDIIKTTGTNLKTIQLDSNTPKILIQSGSGGTANFNEIRMDASAGNIKVRQDGVQVFNTGDRIQPVTAQSFIVKSLPLSSTTLGSTVPVTTVTHLSASQQIGTNNLVVDEIFRMKALEANLASKTPFYVSIPDPLSQTKAVGSNATPIFFEVSKSYDAMDPAHEIGQSAVFSTALTSNNDGGRFVGSSNTTGSAIYHFQTILTEASANHFDDAKFCVMRLDADVSGIATGQNDEFVFLEARSTRTPITRDTRVFQVQYDGDVLSAGNITAFGSSFMNVSDKRLKKDIHTISESLDRILELRPTEFVWKESEKQDVGFIAQEVEEIIPEVVETSRGFIDTDGEKEGIEDMKTVSYPKLVPYLVDTIQVLTKRIEELEKKVK